MEDKYKELLEIHRSKFSRVVDIERLLPILESAEAVAQSDIDEINNQASGEAKVDKVLDILIAKDNEAFKSLCYALELTYPHLLTVMFLGNSQRVHTEPRSVSLTSDSDEDVLSRSQSSADARSQDLKATYTRIIPSYEYDIPDTGSQEGSHNETHHSGAKHKHHVARYKHGLNGENRHSDHNRDYDWLKSQCERAMSELQALKMQQTDNTKRYEAVMKESDSYRQSYMSTLAQLQQSREETNAIRNQNRDLIAENKRMEQEVKNLRKLREEDKQEMAELRQLQRDVISKTGSNEVLNALDMYDRIKQEYDSLRERYSDLVTQHSANVTKFENSKEENTQIKKQYEVVCSERDSAILERNGLKQQCTAAIRNWDQVLHERNDLSEKIIKITQQRDDIMKEMNQALASQLRAKKELEIVQKDRDAAIREYTLIMSERDQVHKEIEQLQEKLSNGSKRIEALLKDKKVSQDEAETLKREIMSALQDRDKSVKERNEISDKYNELCSKQNAIEKEKDGYKKDYEMSIQERDIARKERQEAMQDRDRILREKYERDQVQKEKADKMDQYNKETEHLKKHIEKLQQELMDGMHEAGIAKNRRDWAMSERDKIVLERDSVRTLCDNLRRDRDRAVSDLAQALRDFDDMKKQKQDAVKELKEIKEKYEFVNEKETRKSQLNSVGHNHSRDSAIDADLQEWETETLDIELVGLTKDDLGFDIVGGKDDPQFPNDNSIFVSHVTKGSSADCKLKVNDQVVRINSKEVSNVDKRYAIGLLRSRSSCISMQVLRRRKISQSRSWQVNIPPGKDLGIHVDSGLFISRINPGSYAAKEGLLTVGDRIVSVNGRSVENMTPDDLMKVLYQCGGDTMMLDIWRQSTPINSAGSSPIPIGQCAISSVQETLLGSPIKGDKPWESASESSKGSMKNIKTSGSQTDSLDSPGQTRRNKDKKHSDKDLDHKNRYSVHLFDKALEIFRPRHRSDRDRSEEDKGILRSNRPRTMIENNEDVVGEFAFPTTHTRENSGSSTANRSNGRLRELNDPEISGTGTWPKCVRISNATMNGTVVQPQKPHKRPTLDAVINYQTDNIPTARVPPLPPERNNSSYVAVRHTPQNSDSTITYNSHPPSPLLSPQPSNSSSYSNKSPSPRRGFINAEFTEVQNHGLQSHGSQSQGHHNHSHSAKVNNTRNPPRMPSIQSPSTGQFRLVEPGPDRQGTGIRRRPASGQSRDQRNSNRSYLAPTSHNPARMDCSQFGGRSLNTTPEPLSPPQPPPHAPSRFTDRPPGGRPYPTPSLASHSSMPTPSQPVIAKKLIVQHATTTVHMPPFITPPSTFPDSITELDRLPPYHPTDWASSPSPSQISSLESSFMPTPGEQYPYSSFPNTSPVGRIDQEVSAYISKSYTHRTDRIRIPSTPSIQTNDTSGSVEVVSDRSSPCSPFPDISITKMLPSTLPHVEAIPYRKKPHPGETRRINIEKTSHLVGFQIEMGPSGGIFVSSVNEKSLAAQAGLVIGDQLLEICAVNMRSATYDLAARVLQQCGNNLTMLVQYNPEKYNDNDSASSASSTNTSPLNSPDSKSSKHHVGINGISHRDNMPKSPPRVHSHSSSAGKYDAQRKISFKKPNPNASLGITLAGGNATGIFVHDVEENSPAGGHSGIHCGDQILEYNDIDFRRATSEQAYRYIHEPCSTVRIKVRYHPSLYNKVRNKKCAADSLYVRSMFDHVAEKEGELSFRRDDLLHIEETMYDGQKGIWFAWLMNEEGQKLKSGTIPSKDRLEDNLVLHRSLSESLSLHDSEEYKTPTRRGSGSARRSFFRRSKKHQRNNSKDSRDMISFSDVSLNSDSLPVLDDLSLSTYMSVERLEYKKTRPVVLIAPLADALIQKLSSESPDKYFYCEPSVMQTSLHVMEQGLKDGNFIDYWQQDERFFCIRVKSITDICDKTIHCLLNVNPLAIERLRRIQIYPIVIYARHKSYKQLREVKDVQFLPDKLSLKSAKELYEYCQKAEQDYRHLLSATIQGGNLAEMTQQIKNVIAAEQDKPIWVPTSTLR